MECCYIDAHRPIYRFIVLFFNCLLTFGSYYCFDMPSVLQEQLQGNYSANCSRDTEYDSSSSDQKCCWDCLGLTGTQYNLLYAIYSWTNGIVVSASGFLIDKLGNRVGVFLFSGLCLVGSSIFAVGSMLRGSSALIPLMMFGRLLFGAGNGSLTVVQYRITSIWFHGKELALAFGITLAFSRSGSVLNFFLTSYIYEQVGLTRTLGFGAGLCGIGFISAIIVSYLDIVGMKHLGHLERIATLSQNVSVADIKHLSLSFWLVALTVTLTHNIVFAFVADASKYIQDKYGFDETYSAYMAGAVYDVAMLGLPFLGAVIDVIGKRGMLALLCSVFTIPLFGLLAFSMIHPLIATLWLGVIYTFAAASLWPSIPLVVPQAMIGTAMGITTSFQMIGTGIANLIVGEILGEFINLDHKEVLRKWKLVMLYFLGNALLCTAVALYLNINDYRKGGSLNMNKEELKRMIDQLLSDEASSRSEVCEYAEEIRESRLLSRARSTP